MLTKDQIKSKVKHAFEQADRFLQYIEEGEIKQVYLIGSYAEGTATPESDMDVLVVGDDFGEAVEDKRIELAEAGELPSQFRELFNIDVANKDRPGHIDIIFSSEGARKGQASIKMYDVKKGGWLI